MRRLIPPFATALLTLAISSCGGGGGGSETSLPTSVPLSADGARHEKHAFSPDGKRVAYWSPATDSGEMQLWVANADLTAPAKLPVKAISLQPAQWSPDGTSLAAGSSNFGFSQVVIVPAAGGEVRRVTEGAGLKFPMLWYRDGTALNYYGTAAGGLLQSSVYSLASGQSRPLAPGEKRSHLGAASPDGSHVAYFVIEGEKTTIWVADGNGDHPRQLTNEGFETLEQFQEWSPDGKELLYESRRTGHRDLWIVPIDGGERRQLTHDIHDDYAGAWSGGGKWIAFLSNRGRQTDVWVVPVAGGAEQRITDTPLEEVAPMVWRPGTQTLTFGVRTVQAGVWALDLADGKERRLTADSLRATLFHPSPDGKQLLYVVDQGGGIQDLAVMSIGGGDARVLVAGGGTVDHPQWSPDGQKIAFDSDRGGSDDIWVADVTGGGAPRQVTTWPGAETYPAWNNGGSEIYFLADKDSKLGDIWRIPATGGDPARLTTAGNLGPVWSIPGHAGFFAQTLGTEAGQVAISRFEADGSRKVLWDKSSAFLTMPSSMGDSVLANVQQPDGKIRSMILAADGSGSRLLPADQRTWSLSKDGQWAACGLTGGGAFDLCLLHLVDGVTRRLTTTPESEEAAEFTPDGKTVLFRRVQTVQRITAVDLSKVLGAKR